MSNLVGADVGELRQLAATFNARAAQLKSIESQLSWRIQAAPWEGHDVSRFVQDWNTRHRRVILGAAASVTSAAQELLANAEQQEQASTAGYTGGVPPIATLRKEETSRIESSGLSPWLASIGLAGIAFRQKVGDAHALVSKATEIYLRATEANRVRALSAKAIVSFGEVRAKELLKFVPSVLNRTNGLYRVVNAVDGKFLGPLGVAFSAIDLGVNLAEGKYVDAAVSGVSLAVGVAGTLVAFGVITGPALPFIAVGAAVWGVASIAIEHREEIAKAASWVSEKVSDTAKKVTEGARNAVESASKAARQAVDAAAELARRITNPLHAIFG